MTRKQRPLPHSPVTLIEITDIQETSEDESVDGIHPNDEGMRRHAHRLEQAVRPMLTD